MIEVNNLTKQFGHKTAVDDLSSRWQKASPRFLGPNGAGKSTTMRVITGFLRYQRRGQLWNSGG